jgi:signal transduction histidine kinase
MLFARMPDATAPSSLHNVSLKTKLLLMMVSLLLLSVSSLFLLHLYSERRLISQLRDYTEDLSTAIEVAQEQPAAVEGGDVQTTLDQYAQKLRQLGVKDVHVSFADTSDEVQASTDPQNVGKHVVRTNKTKKGPREYVIRGVLGEENLGAGSKTSTLTIPIVVGERRIGTLLIRSTLEDFSALSKEAFLSRLLVTLGVFALGILLSLYLSWSLIRPLHGLTEAAQKVAAGDLAVQVSPAGGGEIATLARSFNEMVERLREHRALEERLHFAERTTALGRLASAVAHEIRNPLNFINLSIDHVRERLGPEEPRQREDFDRILSNMKAEISRLNRLVGDFLSFGKPMRLHPRLVSVEEVLRDVASLVEHKAKDQGIALEIAADEGLPRIVADPELLKTCFLNLMINGVDAMPEGGVLGLSVRRAAEPAEMLVVTVRDSGQGMSPEDIQSAFEPYFSTKDTGFGLGLALTRKIVADHGGTIALESAPGLGTTARITLPLVAERAGTTSSQEALVS